MMRPVRPCGDVDCPCQASSLDTLAAVHARAVAAEARVTVLAAELAALRDGTAPRGPLAAREPGHTPVPGIPATPEAAQGHSGPSERRARMGRRRVRRHAQAAERVETAPAPVRDDAEGPQNATEGRDDERVVIARLPKSKYALRETPDGWDVLADDDHGAFS